MLPLPAFRKDHTRINQYIQDSSIPWGVFDYIKMNENYFAAVSCDAPDDAVSALKSEFETILLPPDDEIAAPVRSHPDMIMMVLGGKIFFPETYVNKNPDVVGRIVDLSGLELVKSTSPRGPVYPSDVSLNCAEVGSIFLCRKKSASVELLSAADEVGLEVVSVKQGYAGCSTLVLGGSAVTSDLGIFSALTSRGVDCFFYPNEKIRLNGYNCGFIGGCGGTCEGVVYLYGIPDECGIFNFISSRGYSVKFLSDKPLFDCGGIKFIRKGKQ